MATTECPEYDNRHERRKKRALSRKVGKLLTVGSPRTRRPSVIGKILL